jgi:hypothetical protein
MVVSCEPENTLSTPDAIMRVLVARPTGNERSHACGLVLRNVTSITGPSQFGHTDTPSYVALIVMVARPLSFDNVVSRIAGHVGMERRLRDSLRSRQLFYDPGQPSGTS